jgi:hypothetical protein
VTVVIGEQGAKYLQAAFDTDYGAFAGAVSEARVHEHEGMLCFQLSVERLDGSGNTEQWLGHVKVR